MRAGENVFAVTQRKIITKCKDPCTFIIPCTICNTRVEKVMIDLGVSINVMPYFIYVFLKLRLLNKIGVLIQMANRSNVYLKGVVEDGLV